MHRQSLLNLGRPLAIAYAGGRLLYLEEKAEVSGAQLPT